MPGQIPAPLTWVGPVRSHMPPMITSFCCAVAAPARQSTAVAPAATPKTAPRMRLILVPPLLLRAGLIGEWPDPEVISNVSPQPAQPFRLHHQEEDDQPAEQDQPQIWDRVLQVLTGEQQPAVI